MKIVSKKTVTRALSLVVVLAITISALLGYFPQPDFSKKASAASTPSVGDTITVNHKRMSNKYTYFDDPNREAMALGFDLTINGTYHWGNLPYLGVVVNGDDIPAFCIDINGSCPDEDGKESSSAKVQNEILSNTTKKNKVAGVLSAVKSHGLENDWTKYPQNDPAVDKEYAYRIAAQIVIWGIIYDQTLNSTWLNKFSDTSNSRGTMSARVWKYVPDYYDDLVDAANNYSAPSTKKPSFDGTTVTLKDTNGWEVELSDANAILGSDFYVDSKDGLTVTKSGDKLTIKSSGYFTGSKTITLKSYSQTVVNVVEALPTASDFKQAVVAGVYSTATTRTATITVNAEQTRGDLKIIKTSDDGNVANITFTVKKADGTPVGTYTTLADGTIPIPNLTVGDYIVTETVPKGYSNGNASQYVTVTVENTPTNPATVTFVNTSTKGNLSVHKTFVFPNGNPNGSNYNKDVTAQIIDAIVNDISFTLTSTSLDKGGSATYTANIIKDANGLGFTATFSDILTGTYTLHENIGSYASKYVVAAGDQSVTITPSGNGSTSVQNNILTGGLTFTKRVEIGSADGIKFNLKGKSDIGVDIDITVTVGNLTQTSVTPWWGTVNGVKVNGNATVTVKNGTVTFTGIPVGTFTLSESNTPSYLIPMNPKQVTIIANSTITVNTGAVDNPEARGNVTVIKRAQYGDVANIEFTLSGTSNAGESIVLTGITKSDGSVTFNDVPVGSYTLVETKYPSYYIPPAAVTVLVEKDKTTVVTGNGGTTGEFKNWEKYGDIRVIKTIETSKYPEKNSLAGLQFRLTGTSDSGETVNVTAVTNEQGIAEFNNILIGTNYKLEEINTPDWYVQPSSQTVDVIWNGKDKDGKIVNQAQYNLSRTTAYYDHKFHNELKWWKVTVVKKDKDTGYAQGDATLEGAVYGVYDNGVLIDTYTTDENGTFTTDYYECNNTWTIKEITASVGYLVDKTVHKVGSEEKSYKVQYNVAPEIISLEQPPYGSFGVFKLSGTGTGVYVEEVGAEFDVFLTSAGSYENARPAERDHIVIGEDGMAVTKDLPYGMYTLRQTKAWDGNAFIADITNIWVCQRAGETVDDTYERLILNNDAFYAKLRIVKVDNDVAEGEEPKVIPIEGVGFQLFDPDGNQIVQSISYPYEMTFDIFYTNADGMLTLPDTLKYGRNYYVVEVSAPYGYALREEPFYFDVVAEVADNTVEPAVIEIKFPDNNQKGVIQVDKYGEIFASVIEGEDYYLPQYAEDHLKGASFGIYAAEDIYTPDGTLRHEKGDKVDYITTGEDGIAYSQPLFLGKYTVIEERAPYGYVLDDTPQTVTLTYDESAVEVTYDTFVSQTNDRQTLALSLTKILERNELFGLGMNDEILKVSFGLYAGEDLIAADGTMIPEGGLIEAQFCDENGEIKFKTDLPFGRYYVQEISTDEHYVLNGERFEVVFTYQGQDVTVVEITVNDGEIENDLKYGVVGGIKVDSETGEALAEAVIGLFAEDETVFNETTALMITTTDMYGRFAFEDIPYGTYLVRELTPPSKYALNEEAFDAEIKEDGDEVDITIEDEIIPEIGTTATIEGGKEISKTDTIVIDDVVSYKNLFIGRKYTIVGILMDKLTGLPLLIDGKEITASVDFIPDARDGEITVSFIFDASTLFGDDDKLDIVVFETLYEGEYEWTSHADIEDEDQTVRVKKPEIKTTATSNGKHETSLIGTVTIADDVKYHNLTVGKEYTIVGVLMNKLTGEAFLVNGEKVTAEKTFIAETEDGVITMLFEFDASYVTENTTVVVFENMYYNDVEIAAHADIEDEDQTVELKTPEIKTTATSNDEKEDFAEGIITIVDKVEYTDLIAGNEYTVEGTLMDKATGEVFLVDGKPITSSVTFTAEEENGFVEVIFEFDASVLTETTDLVVFEKMFYGEAEIASHEDIDDEDQTVTVKKPEIKTTATSDGTHEEFNKTVITIEDVIEYHDLIVGKKYTVRGVLMDKATGEPLINNNAKVVAETEFIAEEADGFVSVFFKVDASVIEAHTSTVAFETLYQGEREIAIHADIEDEDQTVTFVEPSIGTKIGFNEDLMDELQMMVLDDVVAYKNLIVGREYVVKGTLRNREGNPYVDCSGNEVVGETTFIPETADGEVIVRFILDASTIVKVEDWGIETYTVAFEKLFYKDVEIAAHEDMEDRDQTIDLFQFPEDDIPRGDWTPDTGRPVKLWGVILAATAVLAASLVIYQKKRL